MRLTYRGTPKSKGVSLITVLLVCALSIITGVGIGVHMTSNSASSFDYTNESSTFHPNSLSSHSSSQVGVDRRALTQKGLAGAEDDEDEDVTDPFVQATSIWVTMIFLILVTIFFEQSKEKVLEETCLDMLPIIESLFGEMTVLGFLSVITFIVTKIGIMEAISIHLFGNSDEQKMMVTEIFENVHYCLFGIMIFFVIQVMLLVKLGVNSEKEWITLDHACQDPKTLTKILECSIYEENDSSDSCLGRISKNKVNEISQEQLLFHLLRQEFLRNRKLGTFECDAEEDRVPSTFNYGRYLSMCMGETIAEVVEVNVTTWTCMACLSAIFYALMLIFKLNIVTLAYFMLGTGYFITFVSYVFMVKMVKIRNAFAPAHYFEYSNSYFANKVLSTNERTELLENTRAPTDTNSELLPAWCDIDKDSYKLDKRSKFMKFWLGQCPNRQHLLFWGQSNGADLNLLILRLILLTNGVYAAVMGVTFMPAMYHHLSSWQFVLFVVVSILPMVTQTYYRRRLISNLSHIQCIGCLRRPGTIAKVVREEKTSRAIRAFVVLHKLHSATKHIPSKRNVFDDSGSSDYAHNVHASIGIGRMPAKRTSGVKEAPKQKHYSETMSHHALSDIIATFDCFDDDKSGNISSDELKTLMESLGETMSLERVAMMVSMLDIDGDGVISKDEFLQWYSEQMTKGDDLKPHELAHELFAMFDVDGSGSITIDEFKTALDAFKVGLSLDDITELVKELDEDRNGQIDVEEFASLLQKHAHPPPELTGLRDMF